MQRIECPWCGPRAQTEFEYLCDEQGIEPVSGIESRAEALRRIHVRANHVGEHRELWQHLHGCGGWLLLSRDNLSHEIRDSMPVPGDLP